ncbi:hypothetical protein ABPG77_003933 [Micractinium sp. CCAP 211/92]
MYWVHRLASLAGHMEALGCNQQVECATSCASEGTAGRHSKLNNSQTRAPALHAHLAPTAEGMAHPAGPVPCSTWRGEPYPTARQSVVLPGSLHPPWWQGLPAHCWPSALPQPVYRQHKREQWQHWQQQQQQQQQQESACQAPQAPCREPNCRATLTADELEWLCTILTDGGDTYADSGSWLTNVRAAAALLYPELSTASSTLFSQPEQPHWLQEQQAGGDASSQLSGRTHPRAAAPQGPWPGKGNAFSGSLLSTGSLAVDSERRVPQIELPPPTQPRQSSGAEQQSVLLPARLPKPAALVFLPAISGHTLPKASAALSTVVTQPGGSSSANRFKDSQQARVQGRSASGPSGTDGGRAAAPRQRRFGSRYSDADLEVLKVEDPRRWRRIMTNRRSLAAHLARQHAGPATARRAGPADYSAGKARRAEEAALR